MMQPSHSMEKAVSEPSGWEDGAGRDEKPTLVDAERDASRSKDVDVVGSNEIGYASIDEEAGVINKGGYWVHWGLPGSLRVSVPLSATRTWGVWVDRSRDGGCVRARAGWRSSG